MLAKNFKDTFAESKNEINKIYKDTLEKGEETKKAVTQKADKVLDFINKQKDQIENEGLDYFKNLYKEQKVDTKVKKIETKVLDQLETGITKIGENIDERYTLIHTALDKIENKVLVLNNKTPKGFPIENYTDLNAKEVQTQIKGLDQAGLEEVLNFESKNKARATVLKSLDKLILKEEA